jgi:hypothetical protein
MANDPTRQVHSAKHPSGHPNKTPVNAENPIFHNQPNTVAPLVSVEQAGVVQSDKHHRETVQSPLINEGVESPVGTRFVDRLGNEAAGSGAERYKTNADDWTQTKGAGLTSDTSTLAGQEYRHGSGGSHSSSVTPVVAVPVPTQAEADAAVAKAAAEETERKTLAGSPIQDTTGGAAGAEA